MKNLAFFSVVIAVIGLAGFVNAEQTEKSNPVSSGVCKNCHADIHAYWKNSMHAYSYSDPIFQTAYQKARNISEDATSICLQCHAPLTQLNRDYDVAREITKEGVTCDFCHTITAVSRASDNFKYTFNFDRTRVGPSKDAQSPIHATAYSELHTKAEFCAGCHEFTNERGVKLLETYSEWKNSPYATEGKQCQHCHMPISEGYVVEPSVKKTAEGINLHNLQGGHSVDKVQSAASVRIQEIQKFQQGQRVLVEVKNIGSGHRIPTGTPSRELILEVGLLSVPDNRLIQKKEAVFKKTLADASGRVLETDAEIMVLSDKIVSDNRIRPREAITQSFTFVGMPPGPYRIRAKLYYNYLAETSPGQMQQMFVEMASEEKALYVD